MRVILDEHELAEAGGMPLAAAEAILLRIIAMQTIRLPDSIIIRYQQWYRITDLRYFTGSLLWAWVGIDPLASGEPTIVQLPDEPIGYNTRELAEQAGRKFGLSPETLPCRPALIVA